MSNFNRILENIEMELAELKRINGELVKENQLLRDQLGMSEKGGNDKISIRDVFNQFYITPSDPGGLKTRAFNVLLKSGKYETVKDLEGKTIYDLCSLRLAGPEVCALIVIVLEHYGVQISMETRKNEINQYRQQISKIKEAIVKYKPKIIFE